MPTSTFFYQKQANNSSNIFNPFPRQWRLLRWPCGRVPALLHLWVRPLGRGRAFPQGRPCNHAQIPLASLPVRWEKIFILFLHLLFFFVIPGAWPLAYTIPHGPFWGGGTLDTSLRRRGGVWGCLGSKLLMGRHRDWNPGPPAGKSGVIAITLRGPHLQMVGILLLFWPDLFQCENFTFSKKKL